ncbi:metallophosphoesterase [Devosia elaeis]|uniref:Uncharacterized protein n=1 Tax=Devosia elaeis TaxID=1770058 RepID=A0A178HUY7_9HYPH|nr:metallophosphoesterase [Devosia elaeis]OAM75808.1 hypothetical protein A3840_14220 [Devosia elaeis]
MARRRALEIRPSDRFIADTHFSHQSMLTQCARPFDTVDEMNQHMIESWNAVVDDDTVVWHLGDFSWWKQPQQEYAVIFDQLRGRKRLLIGNHDPEPVMKLKWDQIYMGVVIGHEKSSDTKVALSHYPMREWPEFFRGAIHFHGHTHSNLPSSNRSWDVGVDNQGYVPLTLSEIRARMDLLPNLDFVGVESPDFVVGRKGDDVEAIEVKP